MYSILEFNITEDDFSSFDKKLRLHHQFLEAGKFALGLRNHLGDDPTSKTVRKIRVSFLAGPGELWVTDQTLKVDCKLVRKVLSATFVAEM